MQIFSGTWLNNKSEEKILQTIMGSNFIVHSLEIASFNDVIAELEAGLRYEGEDGEYYPNNKYFGSNKYKKDLSITIGTIKSLFKDTDRIFSFYIKDGHPFYPVFWNFAFLLKKEAKAYVFIGSSSD